MLVHELLGLKNPKRGEVGMELEVEAKVPLPQINEKKWRSKADNSLRGHSMEYCTSEPVGLGDKLLERLTYLCDKLREPGLGTIVDNPRTSFHVHNNVTAWTPVQVWTGACAYWLFENVLTKWADSGTKTREGNSFALRLNDAEAVIPTILRDLRYPEAPFKTVDNDKVRYMGLNLTAVRRFGSLEVRPMRGTIDSFALFTWTTEINGLLNAAKEFKDPAALLDYCYHQGPEVLLTRLVSPQFAQQLMVPFFKDLIDESLCALTEIAYVHNWNKYAAKVEEARPKIPEPREMPPQPQLFVNAEVDGAGWGAANINDRLWQPLLRNQFRVNPNNGNLEVMDDVGLAVPVPNEQQGWEVAR